MIIIPFLTEFTACPIVSSPADMEAPPQKDGWSGVKAKVIKSI